MTPSEIIQKLKKVDGVFEAYEVIATYQIIRNSKKGTTQTVRVELFDAGETIRPDLRYHWSATADDGATATGNPEKTIESALRGVHWNLLDMEP